MLISLMAIIAQGAEKLTFLPAPYNLGASNCKSKTWYACECEDGFHVDGYIFPKCVETDSPPPSPSPPPPPTPEELCLDLYIDKDIVYEGLLVSFHGNAISAASNSVFNSSARARVPMRRSTSERASPSSICRCLCPRWSRCSRRCSTRRRRRACSPPSRT